MAKDKNADVLLGKRYEYPEEKQQGMLQKARQLGFSKPELTRLRDLYDARHRAKKRAKQK